MWWLVLVVSLLTWGSEAQITCRDKNGVSVDWYILYKVPKLNNQELKGLEYFYMDKDKSQWFNPISDSKSVLGNTLQPLLTHKQETPDFGFISYSDQPPNKQAGPAFGHSKGIVMMDRTSGVWLRHSTPKFPCDRAKGIFWPDTGTKFGQTFICVTFDYGTFKQIGAHLLYIRAFPFDSYIPDDFHPQLKSVVKKEDPKPSMPFLDQVLTSRSGQEFKSFAKYSSKLLAENLYLHIAESLSSDLAAHTWRGPCNEEEAEEGMVELSGAQCPEGEVGEGDRAEVNPTEGAKVECPEEGRVDPLGGEGPCSPKQRRAGEEAIEHPEADMVDQTETEWKVDTIDKIQMTLDLEVKKLITWADCNDHSKWCWAEDTNKPWTCIADLNRKMQQDKRPGGALCIHNTKVWEMFKGFIKDKPSKHEFMGGMMTSLLESVSGVINATVAPLV